MRTVQLYVNNQRVDLFKDEEIVVTSSAANISDISKVFTDFTQTFTIPTSKNNNEIFDHFYNNDLDGDYIANERVPARIEINHIPFREGKLQLESSDIKTNQSNSYKVTFYGDVVTLKDLFGDDKLSDLDYTTLNETWTGANVQDSITNTSDLDIRYPLISSSRVWQYGDASAQDISTSGGAIVWGELFPALKDKLILELIEAKYGVTFTGNFLTQKRFTNMFTWWKNRDTPSFINEPVDLEFNAGDISCTSNVPDAVGVNEVNFDYVNPTVYSNNLVDFQNYVQAQKHRASIYIHNTSNSNTWYIDIYKDGLLVNTVSGTGDTTQVLTLQINTFGLDNTYTYKARALGTLTFDFTITYKFFGYYQNTSNAIVAFEEACNYTTTSVSISAYIDFAGVAPDMKVSDWFSGTLKEFQGTCYPTSEPLTYQIEPLEDWYRFGEEVDITEYVDVKDIQVERAKLHKEISFKWEKSKNFLNEAYLEFHGREYGNLSEVFPNYDGGKYEVKLPFENFLFNKFTGENLQVSYSLTKQPDYKPYVPKPVKLYLHEDKVVDFYFNNGTSTVQLTNYMPFGSEVEYNFEDYSINFGEEISSLSLDVVENSLYKTYYQTLLQNLFSQKTRIVTVECILPLDELTKLTLDDAILIRDKKYRINDMSTNLTTGKVKLVLISDWTVNRSRIVVPIKVPDNGGGIVIPIRPPKGGWIDISNPVETKFITSNPTLPATNEEEQNQLITIPSNTSGVDRYNTITYSAYNSDGTLAWEETVTIYQEGSSSFLLKEDGGYLLQENIDRIKI